MKKLLFSTLIVSIVILSFFFYQNHQQPPTLQSIPELDMLAIEKVDGNWIGFMRDEAGIAVGYLEQNWTGNWQVVNEIGDPSPIGYVEPYNNQGENSGIIWGASGLSKGSEQLYAYYFGMISNSQIDQVTLSVGSNAPVPVPLIESEGKTFFFVKRESEELVPYTFRAYSDGKLVASDRQ